ncbi:hypothetical protein ACZ90_01470 [Streptomyces albus subsp. albus]|nr:hypothetical protein ACZ90_01470 [Streptomyces albus subsp. albus]
MLAAGAAVLLLGAAAAVGAALRHGAGDPQVDWPPLYADWLPHLGPGTPAALAIAAALAGYGPPLAARLPWGRLVWAAWAAALCWTWSLALVDGWRRGVSHRLTTEHEYLRAVGRFGDVGAALRHYTEHILLGRPDHWPAHVSGHPPAAVLTFVGLDRAGLGGGGWAGAFCATVGASGAAAVLVALRALGREALARRAAPFAALAPGAVWVGASADGYFAAVAAWALALLALAATRTVRLPDSVALAAGLLFGLACYLSYGLVLLALPAAGVLLAAGSARPLLPALAGVAAVAAAFTAAGFSWWEGYRLLVERYYQGVAAVRPYGYWVWGGLATAVVAAGPASAAGVRRVLRAVPGAVRGRWRRARPATASAGRDGLVLVAAAALAALLVADLSGMSKAETERIWLPFTLWLPPAAALLPVRDHRNWLAAQAVTALLVNHLLLTGW